MIPTYLAFVGATLILVRGSILERLRSGWAPLAKVLRCAQCCGFWVGIAGTPILSTRTGLELYGVRVVDGLISGLSVSLLALVTDATLVHLLGEPEIHE